MTDPTNDNDTNEQPAGESVAGEATSDQLEGALEAAEATLTRVPEIDYLLVADRAEVVNGKLYLMGGSWDRIQPQQFPHRMMLGIAIVCTVTVYLVMRSRWGFAFRAIRDHEDVAAVMGIDTTRYKLLAWALSALFTGVAGGAAMLRTAGTGLLIAAVGGGLGTALAYWLQSPSGG